MRGLRAWSRRNPAGPATLRSTWGSTFRRVMSCLVALGVLGVGATYYQGRQFSSTTGNLQRSTEVLVRIDQSVMGTSQLASRVLYGTDGAHAAALAAFESAAATVDEAFADALDQLEEGGARANVARSHRIWSGLSSAVRSAKEDWPEADLAAVVASGQDPFNTSVWQRQTDLTMALSLARQTLVDETRGDVEAAEGTYTYLALLVVGALGLAATIALRSAGRMNRIVIEPLAEVGRGAAAMHDLDDSTPIEVPRAVAEVRQLADVINQSNEALRANQARLREQAHTDIMTGLPNRAAFMAGLAEMLDAGADPTAVLFVDLDDFKQVNDTMGHAAGDDLLRTVAQRLRATTRAGELVARLGGDEFAVAFPVTAGSPAPTTTAERIRRAVSEPVMVNGQRLDASASIGIAVGEADATSADADLLLGNSDFAMYTAKREGKNAYEVHSTGKHDEALSQRQLSRDLAEAIEGEEFVLHFQPVMDLPSEEVIGLEALIRWEHPTRGLVPPDDFISLAEESGAIIPIGWWVIDQACETLARISDRSPGLTMGVNVSPRQLAVPGFADGVLRTLKRHGVEPDQLLIEITEATAMTTTTNGAATLRSLRDHGVHVALDDFGTGFSSLRYLGELPVDVIKVDRSFVAGRTREQQSTLESIVLLGQRLGLTVVAEGIEETEELERLRQLGGIAGQGFLFARPMPAQELVDYLRQRALEPSVA